MPLREKCPECGSHEFASERRINGDNICRKCHRRWKQGEGFDQADLVDQLLAQRHIGYGCNGCDCRGCRIRERSEMLDKLKAAGLRLVVVSA